MKLSHLTLYLKERFPVVNMALFAILFVTVYAVASYFFSSAPGFGLWEAGGMLAAISFFFRLRVFDEIKDYDLDAINHPHRVLQSGKVTLRQLALLSATGAIGEAAWSLVMGWPTALCWGLAVGYSLLMRYEFFAGGFLKKRLVLYAASHMLIMPLVILWVWSAYAPGYGVSPYFLTLALLSLLGGFSFEIARKIKTAGEERELLDTYSRAIGYRGAIGAVLLVLGAGVGVQMYLLQQLQARDWPYWVIFLLYLGTLGVYLSALLRPRPKPLKMGELFVSLFMLISYLSIIIEVYF